MITVVVYFKVDVYNFKVDVYKHHFIFVMVFFPRFDDDTSGSRNETSETLFQSFLMNLVTFLVENMTLVFGIYAIEEF